MRSKKEYLSTPAKRERIGRPKKGVPQSWYTGHQICPSQHFLHPVWDRPVRMGKPSQEPSPCPAWEGQGNVLLLATNSPLPEGDGAVFNWYPPEYNYNL